MSEDAKVNRREFLADTSAVIVGATTIGGAEAQRSKASPPAPSTFTSPAGSTIPFSQQDLLATGRVRSFSGAQLGEIATNDLGVELAELIALFQFGLLYAWDIVAATRWRAIAFDCPDLQGRGAHRAIGAVGPRVVGWG